MSIIKLLLLNSAIGLAVSASFYASDQDVRMESGRYNVVKINCGPTSNDGKAPAERFTYSYTGLPSWLKANGN